MTCDCARSSKGGCAHAAALLFAAQDTVRRATEAKKEEAPAARETPDARAKRLEKEAAAQRAEMERRRERIRLEQQRQEQERAQQVYDEVDAFIRVSDGYRTPQGDLQEPVSLQVVLSKQKEGLGLELRIGRKRLYVVRSLAEFARCCEKRETVTYGKELTFSHCEEEVRETDVALFWHIVSLAQGMSSENNRLMLTGTRLDQTMRLLMGREIDWRDDDGKTVRLKVKNGSSAINVGVVEDEKGYRMTVAAGNVVLGAAGAYFLCPEEGEILCAFAGAYNKVAPLLRLGKAFPGGAPLAKDQLDAVCANLIRQAGQDISVTEGEDIVRDHTPMPLTTRYYIDSEEGNALACRIVFDYGGELLSPGE